MHVQTQFSVFLINKPGVLAQTLTRLAKEKVNILAMTMTDSVEHGVLRLVTTQTSKTREILKQLNFPGDETEVLCINLPNNAGALAEVTHRLAENHININYAYCTAEARGGRTTGVLKVADLKKAMRVLEGGVKKKATPATAGKKKVRPSPSRRSR